MRVVFKQQTEILTILTLYHQICTKYGQMDISICQKFQHFIVKQKVFICLDPPPTQCMFCTLSLMLTFMDDPLEYL